MQTVYDYTQEMYLPAGAMDIKATQTPNTYCTSVLVSTLRFFVYLPYDHAICTEVLFYYFGC